MTSRRERRNNRYKQQPNASHSEEHRNAKQPANNTESTPPSTEIETPETIAHCCAADTQTTNAENTETNQLVKWTKAVACLTGGLVFVGFVTFLVLISHAIIFYRTDETARKAQSAFVSVREITDYSIGESSDQSGVIIHRISMMWENSGSTQTRDLEIFNTLNILGREKDPLFPDYVSVKPFRLTLPPKASFSFGGLTTTNEQLALMRDGRAPIRFAKYRDVFETKHITMACYDLIAAPVDYTKLDAHGISGRHCKEDNCTDDECERYRSVPAVAKYLEYLK